MSESTFKKITGLYEIDYYVDINLMTPEELLEFYTPNKVVVVGSTNFHRERENNNNELYEEINIKYSYDVSHFYKKIKKDNLFYKEYENEYSVTKIKKEDVQKLIELVDNYKKISTRCFYLLVGRFSNGIRALPYLGNLNNIPNIIEPENIKEKLSIQLDEEVLKGKLDEIISKSFLPINSYEKVDTMIESLNSYNIKQYLQLLFNMCKKDSKYNNLKFCIYPKNNAILVSCDMPNKTILRCVFIEESRIRIICMKIFLDIDDGFIIKSDPSLENGLNGFTYNIKSKHMEEMNIYFNKYMVLNGGKFNMKKFSGSLLRDTLNFIF